MWILWMETGLSQCHNKNKPLTAALPSSATSHTQMTAQHLVSANILVGSNALLLIQTAKGLHSYCQRRHNTATENSKIKIDPMSRLTIAIPFVCQTHHNKREWSKMAEKKVLGHCLSSSESKLLSSNICQIIFGPHQGYTNKQKACYLL